MNSQQFTQEEQASFAHALRYGLNYIATLNGYQKARLADLAREKQYRAVQVHTERFERHPYAPQQAGQLDYWLTTSPDYVAAQEILALLVKPASTAALAAEVTPATIIEPVAETRKRPLPEVALYLVYSGCPLSRQEAKDIALAEGYSSKNSGEALYQDFCKYSHYSNRTGFDYPGAERKGRNMIERITNVLPRLTGKQKECAEKEVFVIDKYIS